MQPQRSISGTIRQGVGNQPDTIRLRCQSGLSAVENSCGNRISCPWLSQTRLAEKDGSRFHEEHRHADLDGRLRRSRRILRRISTDTRNIYSHNRITFRPLDDLYDLVCEDEASQEIAGRVRVRLDPNGKVTGHRNLGKRDILDRSPARNIGEHRKWSPKLVN